MPLRQFVCKGRSSMLLNMTGMSRCFACMATVHKHSPILGTARHWQSTIMLMGLHTATGRLPSLCMRVPACPALAGTLRQKPPHHLQQPPAVPLDLVMMQGQSMQEGLQVVASKQLSADQTMLSKLWVGSSSKETVQGQGTSLLVGAANSCKQPG